MDPRHVPVDVPDGDRIEQSLEVDPEDDSLYPDDVAAGRGAGTLEADPGDVLEQSLEVDLDDEDDQVV
ncbi:hypothetical protein DFO66_101309 [Brevibacterium sanguinis]|uniref:DUF5709 domain-containing protein n=2 Tax=Brevibacterium TaxID=1696 RepID=A0A366IQ74_9MICO|nr:MULTISPECIES: hypothetical protein [Brevibacterium]RBP68082.1 hypothetical protein DFO66_101309 [Brevibacterium sanguinis]RBP74501.1 hypothetical protein DFO65_101220 [Brevibacterium celere]